MGINLIRVGILIFQGKSDSDVHLAWESSCEKLFQVNNLSKEKKSCYVIAYFEGYGNTWWDYTKRFGDMLIGGQPPPWEILKRLMNERYFPEYYRYDLFSKLHNLSQGCKSVMDYYDEFQQLALKLDHRGKQVQYDIIRFKVGLNRDISSHLTLYKFEIINSIFQEAMESKRENKEKTAYKLKNH